MTNCTIPIQVAGTPLFQVQAPEITGGPFRLSATFTDTNGNPVLQIIENEWKLSSGNWDAECIGGKITIREPTGSHCLVLRAEPPNGVAIERLRMGVANYYFEGDEGSLDVFQEVQEQRRHVGKFVGVISDHCHVGFSFG